MRVIRTRGWELAALACLAAAGCGGPDPVELDEVKGAVSVLLRPSEPVPLPPPRLPGSDDLVRLNPRLADAEVESDAAALPERDLASLGPADSSDPNASVRQGAADYQWLKLSGFTVQADDVGEIRLTARFEHAGHFVLTWGQMGRIRVEVQDAGEASEYVISTDGLVEWEGAVEAFNVGVPNEEGGRKTRIEVLSCVLRDRRAAFAAAAGLTRRRVDREVREATYLHGSTRVRYRDVELPPGARLSFGAAVLDEPLELRISLAGEGTTVLFDRTIENVEPWADENLEAAERDAGARTVDVLVEVEGPPEAVLFLGAPVFYRPQRTPPRVVVHLIDTLNAQHMGLYGYARDTSPRMDRLAAEGVWFENAFANSSWTPESVPNLMTSLAARSNGVYKKFSKLAPDFTTVQEVFASAGFATAAFSTNGNAGPARGTDEGFDSFFDHIERSHHEGALRTVPVAQVLNWMETCRDRPTFVYVHTAEPHHPYEPPAPYDSMYDPDYAGAVDGGMDYAPARLQAALDAGAIDARDVEHLVARYDGEIAFADHMLGEMLDHMDDRGLLEDALVVVTADHGEAFGEHGYYGHGGGLYPELLRIPIVVWGPSYVEGGRRVSENVQMLDLMPTLLDLFELDADLPLQGRSLVPLMRGESDGWPAERPILAGLFVADPPRLALIRGKWKLDFDATRAQIPRFGLFDMERDPREHEDLFAVDHDRAREMINALIQFYAEVPRYAAGVSSSYEIGAEQLQRLIDLGYIDDH